MTEVIHVVLVEWRLEMPGEARDALGQHIAVIESAVPGILSITHGASVSTEHLEAGYDWALVITFADAEARDAYLPHPAHVPIAALISEWHDRLVVFDVAGAVGEQREA